MTDNRATCECRDWAHCSLRIHRETCGICIHGLECDVFDKLRQVRCKELE